jgi:hypothetical protein
LAWQHEVGGFSERLEARELDGIETHERPCNTAPLAQRQCRTVNAALRAAMPNGLRCECYPRRPPVRTPAGVLPDVMQPVGAAPPCAGHGHGSKRPCGKVPVTHFSGAASAYQQRARATKCLKKSSPLRTPSAALISPAPACL